MAEPGEQLGKGKMGFDQMRSAIGVPENATHDEVMGQYREGATKAN